MKNVTLNNDATIAYVSNGLTTVSKPVIKGNDYAKTLQDAYNAITYEYANFGNLVNPEIVKQYFPAWKDASDEEMIEAASVNKDYRLLLPLKPLVDLSDKLGAQHVGTAL